MSGSETLDCRCPRCGSTRTRSLPVIYERGTRVFASRRRGWSMSSRGTLSVHRSSTRGTAATLDALHAAPPSQAAIGACLAGLLVVGICGYLGGWMGAIIGALVAIGGLARSNAQGPRDETSRATNEWQESFRCGRCGDTFRPSEREWLVSRSNASQVESRNDAQRDGRT
jgi:DNA-directed RNA polymerase subunit RPC12/RpoP